MSAANDLCDAIRARLPDELRYGPPTPHGRGPAFCCCDLLERALLAAGRAAVAEEREACALVADDTEYPEIAAAIRARKP